MKRIGSQTRETLVEAGMQLYKRESETSVILFDPLAVRQPFELYLLHDHFAGHVIEIDGKGYEFIRSSDSPDIGYSD